MPLPTQLPLPLRALISAHLPRFLSIQSWQPSFGSRPVVVVHERWPNWILLINALYFVFQFLRWILFATKPLMGAMA